MQQPKMHYEKNMDTEGELSINMKKNIVIAIIVCILLNICIGVFFSNKSYKSADVQPARMLIDGYPNADSCVLEVYPNGILEVTSGNPSRYFRKFRDDEGYNYKIERRWRKLSEKQCRKIDDLITQVIEKGEENDGEYGGVCDDAIVHAIIDGKSYETVLGAKGLNQYYYKNISNEELDELAFELIKLSPVDTHYKKVIKYLEDDVAEQEAKQLSITTMAYRLNRPTKTEN